MGVDDKKMKIMFFTKYTDKGASSRYRVYQYLPYLKKEGIKFRVYPFHNENYLERVYKKEKIPLIYYFWCIIKRILFILFISHNYDVVFIQKDLFPLELLSFLLVTFLKKIGKKVILDFDDMIWMKKRDFKFPDLDTGAVIKQVDLIIAGNKSN